jgi:methionyl-tRNA formyltransferase
MRILLVGQAAFAEKVLEGLVRGGDEVVSVVCPPDRGGKLDPVKSAAFGYDIPVQQFPSLKGPEARAAFEHARADLALLAYVTQIVPEPLLHVPRFGTLCFHPSLLPKFRGGSAIPWQLIKGETRTGVTVFWTDAGIDTGPILLQREAAIGPDDTAGSLYYQTLFPLGVQACVDAVTLVRNGNPPRLPQDERLATYDPLLTDAHAAIDWARPARVLHDLIRGCDPSPGAHTTWQGRPLRLFDPKRRDGRADGAAPGTVVALDADGVVVATGEGVVACRRLRAEGAKAAATDVAVALDLAPGARLGAA